MLSIKKLRPLNTKRQLFDRKMLSIRNTQEKLNLIHSEINKCSNIVNNSNNDTYIRKYYQGWLNVLTDSLASVAWWFIMFKKYFQSNSTWQLVKYVFNSCLFIFIFFAIDYYIHNGYHAPDSTHIMLIIQHFVHLVEHIFWLGYKKMLEMAQDNNGLTLSRIQRLSRDTNMTPSYSYHFYHLLYHHHSFISWVLAILITVIIIYGEIFCLNGFSMQNHQDRMPQTATTRTITHNNDQPNTKTNHLSKNSRITYLNKKMKGIELPNKKRSYLINIYKKQDPSLQKHIYNIVQHYDHDIPTNTLKRHLLKYYLQKYNI